MIGTTLGQYRLIRQVGAGGVGVVYLARDERLERDVALKVLSQRAMTESGRRRFKREALALSRNNHPNIATIHDFNNQDGLDYLVMEYIAGRTLSEYLLNGPLSGDETIALGCQLADGLAFAHSKGVVHGDLKPGNILVTTDGRLKILDFGLARVAAVGEMTTQTMTDQAGFGGTLPYMAPEQIRGQLSNARTDIYAAGAVLYEMATGHRPFVATNDAALMTAILDGKPDPPTDTNPQVSAGLNTIVMKALDLDPALRYQSAAELQVDLQRLAGRPLVSISRPHRDWKTFVAAAGAVLTVVLAFVLGWPLVRSQSTSSPPPRSQDASATSNEARLRVELATPEVIGTASDTAERPAVIHALMASELAGMPEISLLDTNAEGAAGRRSPGESADLIVRSRIVNVNGARELQCSVTEGATKEVSFSTRAAIAPDGSIAPAVRELAAALSAYFRVRSNGPDFARDLRPWISSRPYKAEAVMAFVQGAMYVFRFQPGEPRRYFQRALEIEPSFVAPRIWRLPTFIQEGNGQAELDYLRSIEAQASPFEQAMIAFGNALASQNIAAQARHLEVALKYAPGNRILLSSLAAVQEAQGDCQAALETLRPVIEARWAYSPVYAQWAGCAIENGAPDDVRRTLEASLTLAPPSPDVYGFLESLAILRGDQEAVAHYSSLLATRAKDLSGSRSGNVPALSRLFDRVGRHAVHIGALQPAVLLFERAAQLDPSNPAYRDRLADTLEQLGRTRESRLERDRAESLRRYGRGSGGR